MVYSRLKVSSSDIQPMPVSESESESELDSEPESELEGLGLGLGLAMGTGSFCISSIQAGNGSYNAEEADGLIAMYRQLNSALFSTTADADSHCAHAKEHSVETRGVEVEIVVGGFVILEVLQDLVWAWSMHSPHREENAGDTAWEGRC